jgi:hypothetical protein
MLFKEIITVCSENDMKFTIEGLGAIVGYPQNRNSAIT